MATPIFRGTPVGDGGSDLRFAAVAGRSSRTRPRILGRTSRGLTFQAGRVLDFKATPGLQCALPGH
eukprot:3091848-Lingulodinium_polyedra.AAC.1